MAAGLRLGASLVAAVLAAAAWAGPVPAAASPATVDEAQAELDQCEQELKDLESQYDEARTRLEAARHEAEATAAAISDQAALIDSLQARVAQLALQDWQSQGLRSTAVLFFGGDTETILGQLAAAQRLTESTDDLVQRYLLEQADLQDKQKRAGAVAAQIEIDQASLAELKAAANAKVKAAQKALDRLRAVDTRAAGVRAQQAAAVSLAGFPTTDRVVGADTGLRLHVIQVRQIVAALFPAIKTVGGYRAGDWGEHGRGLALDVMIPGWSGDGAALGSEIAAWFQDNAGPLGVDYIIWQQRFWQVGMSGWQLMGDRGSPTQNHMDHVHISFKAGV
ncbi:MAG: hypothetical protein LBI84_09885 [Propionibacteriaceae bacterium]|jgi:hypothetical protein|nr:hypothetical protein [Propionibacteriaceae bacterium]